MSPTTHDNRLVLDCIALIKPVNRQTWGCSRTVRLLPSELANGRQPVCHQHERPLEADLVRISLGISKVIIPSREELADEIDRFQFCTALVEVGDEPGDVEECGHPVVWDQFGFRGPLAVPLCASHVLSLIEAYRRRWDWGPDGATSGRGWGWMIACDFGLPEPTRRPTLAEHEAGLIAQLSSPG